MAGMEMESGAVMDLADVTRNVSTLFVTAGTEPNIEIRWGDIGKTLRASRNPIAMCVIPPNGSFGSR